MMLSAWLTDLPTKAEPNVLELNLAPQGATQPVAVFLQRDCSPRGVPS
jgi:hypothetical protein